LLFLMPHPCSSSGMNGVSAHKEKTNLSGHWWNNGVSSKRKFCSSEFFRMFYKKGKLALLICLLPSSCRPYIFFSHAAAIWMSSKSNRGAKGHALINECHFAREGELRFLWRL